MDTKEENGGRGARPLPKGPVATVLLAAVVLVLLISATNQMLAKAGQDLEWRRQSYQAARSYSASIASDTGIAAHERTFGPRGAGESPAISPPRNHATKSPDEDKSYPTIATGISPANPR